MTTDPNLLLKQLQPAVLPGYANAPARPAATPLEHQRFDALLSQAKAGLIESGRSVSPAYAPTEAFTSAQIQRLSAAADQAEASGARRALLLMDGRGLVLDVDSRTITSEMAATGRLEHLDAAVYVPGEDEQAATPPLPPPGGVAPRGVAEAIDAARRDQTAA